MDSPRILASCLLALALFVSCDKDYAPPQFLNPGDVRGGGTALPAPDSLVAMPGNRSVTLSWTHGDLALVDHFLVYRSYRGSGGPELVASTTALSYVDEGLVNGIRFSYLVGAVDERGIEGYRAGPVSAIPSAYSILIDDGAVYTTTPFVELTLTATPEIVEMMLCNEERFEGAEWQVFSEGPVAWTLTAGDGAKQAYARFRDDVGGVTSPVSDSIILDTWAHIDEVTEDTGGEVRLVADTIHFTLSSGEPDGDARVIFRAQHFISLSDHGTEGDQVANDGTYEVDYLVQTGDEVTGAIVVGLFTDAAGNDATPVAAPGRITINEPPQSTQFDLPFDIWSDSVLVSWFESGDSDFASYNLYMDLAPGVTEEGSELVVTINDVLTTEYTVRDLTFSTTYYLRLFVHDIGGLSTGNDEVAVTTGGGGSGRSEGASLRGNRLSVHGGE
jgi:hypothetical protein